MFKKIMAALMCITMAAAFVGCEKDEDSSSKNESSATEAVTDENEANAEAAEQAAEKEAEEAAEREAEEAEKEAEIQSQIEAENQAAEQAMDTAEVKKILLDGTWQSGYITDAEGNIYTINDFSEAMGTDPSTFDMQMEFAADGTIKMNSATDGEETGTYTVDGILVTLTDDADGSELALVYDSENEMLFVDLLGTGELLIGFTIE